jgi:hypothetical protein
MNSSEKAEKERLRRRLAAQNFLENISLDGTKQAPKCIGRKRSISEDSKFLIKKIVIKKIFIKILS